MLQKGDTGRNIQNKSSNHVFEWNEANLVKDEPVESSSHSDSEENIGQISSVEQQKLQHCLEQEEKER